MTDPWLFVLAVLALLAAPGPTNVLLATAGALEGWRKGLPLLGAEIAGYGLAIGIVRLILVPLLQESPVIGLSTKFAVALYLLWLAFRLWRSRPGGAAATMAIRPRAVFIATLLNPKTLVVALTLMPWSAPNVATFIAGFGLIVLITGAIWLALGAALGAAAGDRLSLLPRLSAVVLTAFAGVIAASAF